eukprot:4939154-Lingulodinium_polyedra.AAC.1
MSPILSSRPSSTPVWQHLDPRQIQEVSDPFAIQCLSPQDAGIPGPRELTYLEVLARGIRRPSLW